MTFRFATGKVLGNFFANTLERLGLSTLGRVLRRLGGSVVIVVGGLVGLSFAFGDLGPHETSVLRLIATLVFFLLVGAGTGALFKRRWPLAGLLCWATCLYGLIGVLRRLDPQATRPAWSFIILLLILPPMVILPASAGGFRLRQWLSRQ